MSDDPIQSIVDKLENIERGIGKLSAGSSTAAKSSALSKTRTKPINEIREAAKEGAALAAARVAQNLQGNISNLQNITHQLEQTLLPARNASEGLSWLSRWKIAALILLLLLSLLSAFLGGVYVTRTGLALSTKSGCQYLGGYWSQKRDESGYICWH